MLFDELPKELKETVANIGMHQTSAIAKHLNDALEKAETFEDFKTLFHNKMIDLISEARDAEREICGD